MGLIIRYMEMPKTCHQCKLKKKEHYSYFCSLTGFGLPANKRSIACPLEEIPTPHGGLVDIESLEKNVSETSFLKLKEKLPILVKEERK